MIKREDMLELTRRMTVKRTHLTRVAGCYVDEDGDFDGSFNTAFGNLSVREKEQQLAIARAIPFAATNDALREIPFPGSGKEAREMWQLLMGLRECGLKNDAVLDIFYDKIMEIWHPGYPYSVHMFHGVYDIPRKAGDKSWLGESEAVYAYLICALCPLEGEYEPGSPVQGFLFPAYADQCADLDHVDLFRRDPGQTVLAELLCLEQDSKGNFRKVERI